MKAWLFRYWKVMVAIAGIFFAGAVFGGVATSVLILKVTKERLNPDNWSRNAMDRLERTLDLSAEQRQKIEPIVQKTVGKSRQIVRRAGAAWGRNIMAAKREIEPHLNEEQRQKLDDLFEYRVEKFRRFLSLEGGDLELPPPPPQPEEPSQILPPASDQEHQE